MIASFRQTVIDWLDTILIADIFVSPTGLSSEIAPAFIEQIGQEAEISQIALARTATVFAPDYGLVQLNAFSDASTRGRRNFLWSDGAPDQARAALRTDHILISEVFARQHHLPLNKPSEIILVTQDGARPFRVAGIFYDYAPRGFILLDLQTYRRFWSDEAVSNVAIYLQPQHNADEVAERLQTRYAGQYQLNIVPNQGLKQSAIIVFDRTFTITIALRLLATVVAFIGVLSALMALQLEKTKELGTLRANGMTVRQLWGVTLLETGLMGVAAGLIALPTGLMLATILIYVINLRSFGWSLQMQLTPQVFFLAFLVALAAALLAGVYPAIRLGKMEIAAALREE